MHTAHPEAHPESHSPEPASQAGASAHVLDWFRLHPTPFLLIGLPDLALVASNIAGEAMIEEGVDLRRHQVRLTFWDASANERFRQHLAQHQDEDEPWILKRRDEDHYLILQIDRIEPVNGAPAIMVAVHSSDGGYARHRWGNVDPIYGLTPAEGRIARKMTGGQSVEDLAGDLQITIETARTHIRRIYGKVGVNSREQLTTTLLPFRVG